MRLLVTAIALSAALVAGCTHSDVIVGGGPIVTGADGVRTFTPVSSINGNQAVCTLASFDQDSVVRGRVASDPTRSVDSVWLRSPQGDDLHVVWPGAWSFAFEAEGVVISDAQGQSIASEGDEIVLAGHPSMKPLGPRPIRTSQVAGSTIGAIPTSADSACPRGRGSALVGGRPIIGSSQMARASAFAVATTARMKSALRGRLAT